MTIQFSTTVRHARLNVIESTIGTAPRLHLFSGAAPATCATANSGNEIISIALPSDWLNAASAGAVTLAGVWSGSATGAYTVGHFRIRDSTDTTVHMQGSCGQGTGDLSFDVVAISVGQTVTVTTFTITEGNA